MTTKLHVYSFDYGEEFYVAESADHARQLASETMESDWADDVAVEQAPDDELRYIWIEDGVGVRALKTKARWCEWNGPGYLCGRNW